MTEVRVGQLYRDCDKRRPQTGQCARFVRVVAVGLHHADVESLERREGWASGCGAVKPRKTVIRLDRLVNPKHFALVEEAAS